jgi:hypothetical protein
VKKSDDDERRGGRTYIDPSDRVLHHATGRDQSKVARRAPGERGAVAFLIEHDDDGLRPRREFFSLIRDHFGLHAPSRH